MARAATDRTPPRRHTAVRGRSQFATEWHGEALRLPNCHLEAEPLQSDFDMGLPAQAIEPATARFRHFLAVDAFGEFGAGFGKIGQL